MSVTSAAVGTLNAIYGDTTGNMFFTSYSNNVRVFNDKELIVRLVAGGGGKACN